VSRKLVILILLVLTLTLTACGNPPPRESNSTDAEPSEVMTLYKQKCLSCHAADLSGRIGPSLETVGARLSKEEVVTIITMGVRGMPSFKRALSAEEIDTLAVWLEEMKESK